MNDYSAMDAGGSFEPPDAKIRVVGVGGGGGNALNTMIASGMRGVDFVAANTDVQALRKNLAPVKLHLGQAKASKGLGAGANPAVGAEAALESRDQIARALEGSDMVFITAGMGGGTGTGGAPVVAQVARELGALTVGVVTKPFRFEAKRRAKQADHGIETLREHVDTLIVIANERLLGLAGSSASLLDAFKKVDEVLLNAVQGISDLVTMPGQVNVDFADVKAVMSEQGLALMGTGRASGEARCTIATRAAIESPLLEDATIQGAMGILMNITSGPGLTLMEVNEAALLVSEQAHEDVNFIWGWVVDPSLGDEVRATVIATGFEHSAPKEERFELPVRRRAVPPALPKDRGYGSISHAASAASTERGQLAFEAPAPRGRDWGSESVAPMAASAAQRRVGSGAWAQPGASTATAVRTEGGASGSHAGAEIVDVDDELDVPAFLRRPVGG